MFRPIQEKKKLSLAVFKQIEKQRNGEIIDTTLVKKVTESFVSLGLRDSDSRAIDLSVYEEHLEEQFLEATGAYYMHESTSFLAENSVTDYMQKVETRLKEESDRVEVYLHPTTHDKLLRKIDQVLIEEHKTLLRDAFQPLLENDQTQGAFRNRFAL